MSAHKWAILLLVSLLVLTSVCAVASAQSTGGTVKINSPSNNGKAGPTQPVSGIAQLAKGYSLWIVPYDPTAGIYYPQASPVTVGIDAKWSTLLSVGSTFGVGKTFQILAVTANPSANSALSAGAAQRIAKLPSGAQAVDAVTVTRVATNVAGSASATPSPTALPTTSTATSSTATANPSTTNVVQVSSAAKSQNPLPGFEVLYGIGALATMFVALRLTRQRRGG